MRGNGGGPHVNGEGSGGLTEGAGGGGTGLEEDKKMERGEEPKLEAAETKEGEGRANRPATLEGGGTEVFPDARREVSLAEDKDREEDGEHTLEATETSGGEGATSRPATAVDGLTDIFPDAWQEVSPAKDNIPQIINPLGSSNLTKKFSKNWTSSERTLPAMGQGSSVPPESGRSAHKKLHPTRIAKSWARREDAGSPGLSAGASERAAFDDWAWPPPTGASGGSSLSGKMFEEETRRGLSTGKSLDFSRDKENRTDGEGSAKELAGRSNFSISIPRSQLLNPKPSRILTELLPTGKPAEVNRQEEPWTRVTKSSYKKPQSFILQERARRII